MLRKQHPKVKLTAGKKFSKGAELLSTRPREILDLRHQCQLLRDPVKNLQP